MSKDLWFAEMERLLAEKQDAGVPFDQAYEQACDEAHVSARDRLADMIDEARLRKKEGR